MTQTTEASGGSRENDGNDVLAGSLSARPLQGLDREVRGFVRERPLLTLGLAIFAGFVAGRIFSRL